MIRRETHHLDSTAQGTKEMEGMKNKTQAMREGRPFGSCTEHPTTPQPHGWSGPHVLLGPPNDHVDDGGVTPNDLCYPFVHAQAVGNVLRQVAVLEVNFTAANEDVQPGRLLQSPKAGKKGNEKGKQAQGNPEQAFQRTTGELLFPDTRAE